MDDIYDDLPAINEWMFEGDEFYVPAASDNDGFVKYLRQDDYTLNSPIILDDLERAYQFRNCSNVTLPRSSTELKTLFEKVENPVAPRDIHSATFKAFAQIYHEIVSGTEMDHLLPRVSQNLQDEVTPPESIDELLRCFYKRISPGASHHTYKWRAFVERLKNKLKDQKTALLAYWALHKTLHCIVLIMNRIDENELKSVIQNNDFYLTDDYILEEDGSLHLNTRFLGKILINNSGILIYDYNIILNKHFTLMFQDIYSNRVNTILLLLYPDDCYNDSLLFFCEDIYNLGDDLITSMGNDAFDIIKMIEPICNNTVKKLCETSNEVRGSKTFDVYLIKTIDTMNKESDNKTKPWFNHLGKLKSIHDAIFVFGMFRHWGHPFIEYFQGLEKLHENVTMEKEIDEAYVTALASDLARKIFRFAFKRDKSWPVDISALNEDHRFYKHVRDSTWPNRNEERSFGDNWHLIPMTRVYDLPTSINLADILDDKSHSLNYDDLVRTIQEGTVGTADRRKVIISTLFNQEINIADFLSKIDSNGLDTTDLVIGLRAKERELKIIGRFFALMTIRLRTYFVITELLIAKNILPLFPSITMTDSMVDVFKKMSTCAPGHGTDFKDHITYAEHFDYEKWNNHQRYESTAPIFRVMDHAFGFSNLITRTHEFFQGSFIYFANRPDLMEVVDGKIMNKRGCPRVCWDGQAGGLEGLRQKGWSVISLLMINRESKNRNPKVRTLAQGDNQVVCITYVTPRNVPFTERVSNLHDLFFNRECLLSCIHQGAKRLGLIIKPDESWGSYNYMIYGKFALVGGNIICSESKRYSRINHVSNDQIQSLSNTLSSVVTTCLTVCQQSDDIVKPIHMYCLFGSMIMRNLLSFNLVLRKPCLTYGEIKDLDHSLTKMLLLDSSLGGLGGSSLLRFLIRQFPDAVTESLTFWKIIYEETADPILRKIALQCGHPVLKTRFELMDLMKLIESPTSLNCEHGVTTTSVLKNLVREALHDKVHEIRHETIRECIFYSKMERVPFLNFLNSITPRFPRFLSNFYNASIHGFTDSVVSLIQNSRTIRSMFTSKISSQMYIKVQKTELNDIIDLLEMPRYNMSMWECSSELADQLRLLSWGSVIGATVPHPAELIRMQSSVHCDQTHGTKNYVTCHYQPPFPFYPHFVRGPCKPYIGSSTSDLTDMYSSWEKKTDHRLLKKAVDLRIAIGWFIEPNSILHDAVTENLQSMIEDDAKEFIQPGPERGGSYIHRYKTPYQSSGGYSAVNFNKLQYILSTTDTMKDLNDTNWDFMFQSLILYAQTTICTLDHNQKVDSVYHGHISCSKCLRPVADSKLTTDTVFPSFQKLTNSNTLFVKKGEIPTTLAQIHLSGIPPIGLDSLSNTISSEIGLLQGFLHTIFPHFTLHTDDIGLLFPKSVFDPLNPQQYLRGFLHGIVRGTVIVSLFQQFMYNIKDRPTNLQGQLSVSLNRISETKDISSLISAESFHLYLSQVSGITGSQYPLNENEVLNLLRTFLTTRLSSELSHVINEISNTDKVILFPETLNTFIACGMLISIPLVAGTLKTNHLTRGEIQKYSQILISSNKALSQGGIPLAQLIEKTSIQVFLCNTDLRIASKCAKPAAPPLPRSKEEYTEYEGKIASVEIVSVTKDLERYRFAAKSIPRYCPLISGLRLIQLQTGAHYKLKCLFKLLGRDPNFIICGGDHSGGFTSTLLRKYPNCQVAFNSLLKLANFPSGGIHPAPPSAISRLPPEMKMRCINLNTAWEELSDLRLFMTWKKLIAKFPQYSVDLVIVDAEVDNVDGNNMIVTNFLDLLHLMSPDVRLIYKCYYSLVAEKDYQVIDKLCSSFENLRAVTTEYTGSFSSEFYMVCSKVRRIVTPRYLELVCSKRLAKIIRSNSSPVDEFNRACFIKLSNTCKGLHHYWINAETILIGLLMRMDLAPTLAIKISQFMKHVTNGTEFVAVVLFGLGYLMKELNRKVDLKIGVVRGYPIPSADWLESFALMIRGTTFHLSYVLRNYKAFEEHVDAQHLLLYSRIQNDRFEWGLSSKSTDDRIFKMGINRKQHLSATWIRVWESFRYEQGINVRTIDFEEMKRTLSHSMLQVKYKYMNADFIMRMTGFPDILKLFFEDHAYFVFNHHCPNCAFLENIVQGQEEQHLIDYVDSCHECLEPS